MKTSSFALYCDEPLNSIKELEFGVRDYVVSLAETVEHCPTPYHIGIFAPWGAGKTTVLDAMESQLRECCSQTKVVRINAWKYRSDSLRRKLLLEATKQLETNGNHTQRVVALEKRMYSLVSGLSDAAAFNALDPKRLKSSGIVGLIAMVAVALIGIVQALVLPTPAGSTKLKEWGIHAAAFLGAPLILFLLTYFANSLGRVYVDKGEDVQLNSQEQFEARFLQSVHALQKQKRRLLVLVDELDRCSPQQVLEALETVKTFMNCPNCIFVVACDPTILEQALSSSVPLGSAHEYLDKIFQLKVQVPPILPSDMHRYAVSLLQAKLQSELPELLSELVSGQALEVLVRPEVTTPRKVKRLLNDFLVKYRLALAREREWKVDALLTSDLPFLAKMVVIESEFPFFYADLLANEDLINWLDRVRQGKLQELEPYQVDVCSKYYTTDPGDKTVDWSAPLPSSQALIAFLGQTWQYKADSLKVRRHLYLTQEPEIRVIGDAFIQRVVDLAESGQRVSLEQAIVESADLDAIMSFFAQRTLLRKGNIRTNLLIATADLARFAPGNSRGFRMAASALSMHAYEIRAALVDGVGQPTSAIPLIPLMPPGGAEQWMDMIRHWIELDPKGRASTLFSKENVPFLNRLPRATGEIVDSSLWLWASQPGGARELAGRIEELASDEFMAQRLASLLPKLVGWFSSARNDEGELERSQQPTESQVGVVKGIISSMGTAKTRAVNDNAFWTLMESMLSPAPLVEPAWVLDIIRGESPTILPEKALSVTLAVVASAADKSVAESTVADIVGATMEACGSCLLDDQLSLMTALVENLSLTGVWNLVSRYRKLWSGADISKFCDSIVTYIYPKNSAATIGKCCAWLRELDTSPSDARVTEFYSEMTALVAEMWNVPDKMAVIKDVLVSGRPYAIPEKVRDTLRTSLWNVAFSSDRNAGRVDTLVLLSKLIGELGPEQIPTLCEAVRQLYLAGEPSSDRYKVGCDVIAYHAPSVGSTPALVANLVDLLAGNLPDKAKGASSHSALAALATVLPWTVLKPRQPRLLEFLNGAAVGEPDSFLSLLERLIVNGWDLDFGALVLRAVVAYPEDGKRLTTLANFVVSRQDKLDLAGMIRHVLGEPKANAVIKRAAEIGGSTTMQRITEILCDSAREPGYAKQALNLLVALQASRSAMGPRLLSLIKHFLTGTAEERNLIAPYLPLLAKKELASRLEQEEIRRGLLDAYLDSLGASTSEAIVKAMVGTGLMTPKLRADIEHNLPEDPSLRDRVVEAARAD